MKIRSLAILGLLMFYLPLAQAALNLKQVGQYGSGEYKKIKVLGNYLYTVTCSGVDILDIRSNPTNPTRVGTLQSPSCATDVVVTDKYAYVADDKGLHVIDISNLTTPKLISSLSLTNAHQLAISGNYVHVDVADGGVYGNFIKVIDVTNPSLPVQVGSYGDDPAPYTRYNFAIVGNHAITQTHFQFSGVSNDKLQIYDISNPTNIVNISSSDSYEDAYMSDFSISGSYVYMINSGMLYIFDISDPTAIKKKSVSALTSDARNIMVLDNYAYIANGYAGLTVIDINNVPPTKTSSFQTSGVSTALTIFGKYVYVADGNGLQIMEVTLPTPTDEINLTYVNSLKVVDSTGFAEGITISKNYAYLANGDKGLQIIDLNNPIAPALLGNLDTSGHAGKVLVLGNYAYIADGNKGLQIIDISNPLSPILVSSFDTLGNSTGVAVSGNYVYIADGDKGLQIIDISNPASPTLAGSYTGIGGKAYGVTVSGNNAYIASLAGLRIIDISNPTAPNLLGKHTDVATDVAISGNYAYVAGFYKGLLIFDISNSNNPILISSYDTLGTAFRVTVSGNYAYIADVEKGVHVINISNPAKPTLAASFSTTYANEVAILDNHLYVAGGENQLVILSSTGQSINNESHCAVYNPTANPQVNVPCVQVGTAMYQAGMNIMPSTTGLRFGVTGVKPITLTPSANCAIFPYNSSNRLRLNCVNVNANNIWAELELTSNPSAIEFDLKDFGTK